MSENLMMMLQDLIMTMKNLILVVFMIMLQRPMDYGEEFNIMKFHDVSKNIKQYVITAIMQEITKGLIKVYVI